MVTSAATNNSRTYVAPTDVPDNANHGTTQPTASSSPPQPSSLPTVPSSAPRAATSRHESDLIVCIKSGDLKKFKEYLDNLPTSVEGRKRILCAPDRKEGLTPLHWAVKKNNLEMARLLAEQDGIDLNRPTTATQETPLHMAATNGIPTW